MVFYRRFRARHLFFSQEYGVVCGGLETAGVMSPMYKADITIVAAYVRFRAPKYPTGRSKMRAKRLFATSLHPLIGAGTIVVDHCRLHRRHKALRLTGQPLGGRMSRHLEPQHLPPAVPHNQSAIGTKRTIQPHQRLFASGVTADITLTCCMSASDSYETALRPSFSTHIDAGLAARRQAIK
jgi:hypothetical protein